MRWTYSTWLSIVRFILPESRRGALAWLALVICVCYFNSLSGAFQFDDYKIIVDYPGVHSWDAWREKIGYGIRPLLKLSYTLNWISGWGVAGFHLTNLLIHLCNVWLVYSLAGEFVRAQAPRERLRDVPLLTALLFAAHPVNTEAVTYICGRSISLMTLFYLAGMLAYVTGRTQHNKIYLHVLAPALFVIALSVKETAVTFPLALLAWELCCGGTWKAALTDMNPLTSILSRKRARRQTRNAISNSWTSWLVLLLGALFFLFNASYLAQMERSAGLNSLQGNMATQALAFAYLLRQWLLPFWLNIDPDLHVVHDFSGTMPQLLLLAAAIVLMLYTLRRRPWIGFGLAWVLIQLLPLYILLPRLDVANDRQMYLAGWPLALAGVAELSIWARRRTLALVFALGSMTILRNDVYQDEITLWENTLAQSPGKARAHNNLGYAYMVAGRNGEARREFIAALKIEPGHVKAWNNLSRLESEAVQLP